MDWNQHHQAHPMHYLLSDELRPVPVSLNEMIEAMVELNGMHWTYQTKISDDLLVSSAFLSFDMSASRFFGGEPELFETMIFGSEGANGCERHATLNKCVERHHAICEYLNSSG